MTLRAIGSVPPTVFDPSPIVIPVKLPSGFVPAASVPTTAPGTYQLSVYDQKLGFALQVPESLPFVDGTEIDFGKQGLNAAFVFRNPNVTGECGCGESFTVMPEYTVDSVQEWLLTPGETLQTKLFL